MIQEQVFDARPDTSGGYKVDVSRGENVDRVSSECVNRHAKVTHLGGL
jgi:hypothetical protein